MKQNFTHKGLARLYFIMRVSLVNVLLLVTPCLQVVSASPVKGQNIHDTFVSINVERVSLKKVFDEIEDQTDFLFVYPPELVRRYSDITLRDKHGSVQDILNIVLGELPIAFKENGGNILLFRKSIITSSNESITSLQPVTGKVTELSSGVGIPGVSVVIKGTSNGTTTDAEGRYVIDTRNDDVLVFSSVGYKNQEIHIDGRSIIDIQMEEDIASLNEVVINGGYYKTTLQNKVGSIVQVSEKDIRDQPVTSPLLALQGRLTGVDISPGSGVPGGGVSIRIRGRNSFRFDGGYPLYVIDGVPVDSSPLPSASNVVTGDYDPLSALNPSNIESIEVLKDADATAIYGSRGANGVVLITTKQAGDGKTSADFSMYRGIGKVPNKLDLLNTQEYLELRREAFRNNDNEAMTEDNAPDFLVWDTTRYTDWQRKIIGGTSDITDFQGGISGGNATTSFRLGGGYHKETTIFPGDFYFKRLTGSFTLSHLSRNKKLRISTSANYGVSDNFIFDSPNAVPDAQSLSPNAPELFNQDGTLNWEPNSGGGATWRNPLAEYEITNKARVGSLLFNSVISYSPMSGVIVKANIGYNDVSSSEILKKPLTSYNPQDAIYYSPESAFGNSSRRSWIVEPQVLFSRRFGAHGLDVLVGTTFQEGMNDRKQIYAYGYASDALLGSLQGASDIFITGDETTQYRYTALFSRIEYDWKEKYFFNLTGRRDGSSRFGPDNRFGNFGSIGAAWIFSKEPLIADNMSFLSFGKLRGSVGTTGNDQIGDYRYLDTYSVTPSRYYGSVGLLPTGLNNPAYKWEVNKKIEAGLELSLLKNRVSFEVAWYRNRSSNQLTDYQLPGTTGFSSILRNLDATIENTGWEYSVNLQIVNRENVQWSTSVNYSRPRNELIKFTDIDKSPYAQDYIVGESLSVRRLYQFDGVNPETGIYTFRDVDTNGKIDQADRNLFVNVGRTYFGGVNNIIKYKSIELSFLLQFVKQTSKSYVPLSIPGQMVNLPKEYYEKRWRENGDETNVQKVSTNFSLFTPFSRYNSSDNSVVGSSFLRMKTLSLSYSLPSGLVSMARMQHCRIFLQGQNLFTVTDFFGLDPETGSSSVPPLRVVSVGAQLTF